MLHFDKSGYLIPDAPIEIDLLTFEKIFVFNDHRRKLFNEYLNLINLLSGLGIGNYFQWVDGSFVSQKPMPQDIDIVTFVNYRNFPDLENVLSALFVNSTGIDCYFVISYPEEHPSHNVYKLDIAEWRFLFSTTRRDKKTGKRVKKGFIQLNF